MTHHEKDVCNAILLPFGLHHGIFADPEGCFYFMSFVLYFRGLPSA